MTLELITRYDAFVAALVAELEACGPGDRALLRVYLIEPGASSEAVLAAARAAASRGATVELSLDGTAASALSRLVEGSGTLRASARALADEQPERVRLDLRRVHDHAKLFYFARASAPSSALLGGMNLGDRFAAWRDFMLVLRGPAVEPVARLVTGEAATAAYPPAGPVALVDNDPRAKRWGLKGAFEALLADPRWVRFQVAMAYLDRTGARLLELALARGAAIELCMPKLANVYQQANLRALGSLLATHPTRLRARWHPAMVHAKALVAHAADGEALAFLGSCNLKRNSFRLFGELNAFVREPTLCADLARALADLCAEAEPVEGPLRYARLRAAIEERLG